VLVREPWVSILRDLGLEGGRRPGIVQEKRRFGAAPYTLRARSAKAAEKVL
jgi:hypothetical protein